MSSSTALQAERGVRFKLIPHGGQLLVDGRVVDWFGGGPTLLSIGPHRLQASVPRSHCCKTLESTLMVVAPPSGDPTAPQLQLLKLDPLPASVRLAGAPVGGVVSCPELGLTVVGSAVREVQLADAQWLGPCRFLDEAGTEIGAARVTLRSGESNTVPWPH